MARSHAETIRAANAVLLADVSLEAIGDFFTSDYVAHLTDQDLAGGHDAIRKFLRKVRRAFPDVQAEVEILLTGKDRVAWQRTLRGTHRGNYAGFPATGRQVVWRDLFTSRFRDGKIAEDWVVSDLAERLLLARKR